MSKKFIMHSYEMQEISMIDKDITRFLKILEELKKFNVGDILIAHEVDIYDNTKTKKVVNSYGVAVKYEVVHVSDQGIPYITELSRDGKKIRPLFNIMPDYFQSTWRGDEIARPESENYECDLVFQLDPEYLDSMIIGGEYDPCVSFKYNKDLHKEITQHNKQARVSTSSIDEIAYFFTKLKHGDSLWTSHTKEYIVSDVQLVTRLSLYKSGVANYSKTKVKGQHIPVLSLIDKKNKLKKVTPDYFLNKMLYTQRPRSYKELKS